MSARAVDYAGRQALVTGASSGIGEAFARTLAARGADVLLTALPEEAPRLDEIAGALAAAHGIRAETAPMDLGAPDGPQRLHGAAEALGFTPSVLVNSAGLGAGGPFSQAPLERELLMIRLNVLGLVALTGLYLPRMVERGDGVIVNIGSTAGLQPMPYFAVYAATKAFVQSFGEALWAEGHRTGVRAVTLCSGPVSTPFHERAGDRSGGGRGVKRVLKRRHLTTDMVVASALQAVDRDRPTAVRRIAGARPAAAAVGLAATLAGRRGRLLATERVNRWLFGVR